ncbi:MULTISPECIES: hypothetical protein [Sphingobium]|uniref:hypothetical protein n=1 Tax=Sphingobium TaxID=165695 RepID=UPI001D181AF2|nr:MULTISPECIES: hypothetical protein [Sphingobium]MCC4256386.1 hypothetical protein [Sphingobium lactosutens]MEE2741510.1 hypothetical protein [Pseudomonadota bacterium]
MAFLIHDLPAANDVLPLFLPDWHLNVIDALACRHVNHKTGVGGPDRQDVGPMSDRHGHAVTRIPDMA